MKMRRMLPGVLSVVLALSLAACGGVPRQGEASEASMAPPPSAFETLKRAVSYTHLDVYKRQGIRQVQGFNRAVRDQHVLYMQIVQ